MADIINYNNLFDRIRILVKYFNELETRQTSVAAGNLPLSYIKNQVVTVFEDQGETDQIATLEAEFDAAITNLNELKLAHLTWFEKMLEQLAVDLGEYAITIPEAILTRLADAMTKDSETVNARETSIDTNDVDTDDTIKAHTDNKGDGKLVYTFAQAGLTPNEISHTEFMHCECISVPAIGQEIFQLSGAQSNSRESHLGQGSGRGPTIMSLGESITNGDFDDWTVLVADNWTAISGTWGTDMLKEDTEVLRGSYSLESVHTQTWQIVHALPVTLLPNGLYLFGLWLKATAGTVTGELIASIVDAAGDDVGLDKLTLDLADLVADTWEFKYVVIPMPGSVDSTWKLSLEITSQGEELLWIDAVQFGPMTVCNGIHFGLCSGGVDFGLDDKFGYGGDHVGFQVKVDQVGVLQKFFGRCFGVQLPSATGAAETQADP